VRSVNELLSSDRYEHQPMFLAVFTRRNQMLKRLKGPGAK